MNLTSLNNQVGSKNNLSSGAVDGSGSRNERAVVKNGEKWKKKQKNQQPHQQTVVMRDGPGLVELVRNTTSILIGKRFILAQWSCEKDQIPPEADAGVTRVSF